MKKAMFSLKSFVHIAQSANTLPAEYILKKFKHDFIGVFFDQELDLLGLVRIILNIFLQYIFHCLGAASQIIIHRSSLGM